ncbi:MAG: hypothetical protein R3A50_06695 [Saprospiraceae bacterium]
MKQLLFPFIALLVVVSFSSCLKDSCSSEQTYVRFDPVYVSPAEIHSGIAVEAARPLHNPGKLYALGKFLFINERQEGIHVFDNEDPANPKALAFWSIPGNVDMVIKDHFMYADQYIDLITIDLSDMQNPQLVCRVEEAFPLYGFDPLNGYIVDYVQTEVTEKVKCNDYRWNNTWFTEGDAIFVSDVAFGLESSRLDGGGLPAGVGIAGSFARFGIANDYLYTVESWLLRSWTLSNPTCPVRSDSVYLGWNAETIFPWKDRLFVGSQAGVFIFDNSNPAHPVMEASFSHATGCDPVVCDDQYAYVTIHDGTTCNGTFNQLDVIDIKNLPNASLTRTYEMERPMGLSVTNEHLFVCDDGLKIFDKSNPQQLVELSHLRGLDTYDVIAFTDSHLLLIGADGFFQFDVSDPANPTQLSQIPVVR